MTEPRLLPYLDIPSSMQARKSEGDEAPRGTGKRTLARIQKWRAQCPNLTLRSDLHRRLPSARDRFRLAYLLELLLEKPRSIASALQIRTGRGRRRRMRIAIPVPEHIKQEKRWNALMARQQKSRRRLKRKGAARASRSSSTRSARRSQKAAQRPMRLTSTARSISRAAGP